jgi:hypothetical protein
MHIGTIVIVALSLCATASAQQRPLPPRPNLSGSWSVTPTESALRLAQTPLGARFTVKQDASSITISTDRETVTYPTDDSKNTRTNSGGRTSTRISRARFVGAALLVTTEVDAGQTGHWEDMFVVALDHPGTVTVVAFNTTKSPDGGMGTLVFTYTKTQ